MGVSSNSVMSLSFRRYLTVRETNVKNQVLNTSGDGLWSDHARAVTVTGMDVPYVNDEHTFGELRVYFDTDSWDVYEHGLIYTDTGFEAELIQLLTAQGFDASDVSYSEQGMQGDRYVSLDVGETFIRSWKKMVDEL